MDQSVVVKGLGIVEEGPMKLDEMTVRRFELAVAESAYRIEAVCVEAGADLVVVIGGGERYHVGALGLTITLPSIKDEEKLTHSTYQIPVPGHKEEALAREGSRELVRLLKRNVVLSVGIHEDDLTQEGIQQYMDAFNAMVDMIGQAYQVR